MFEAAARLARARRRSIADLGEDRRLADRRGRPEQRVPTRQQGIRGATISRVPGHAVSGLEPCNAQLARQELHLPCDLVRLGLEKKNLVVQRPIGGEQMRQRDGPHQDRQDAGPRRGARQPDARHRERRPGSERPLALVGQARLEVGVRPEPPRTQRRDGAAAPSRPCFRWRSRRRARRAPAAPGAITTSRTRVPFALPRSSMFSANPPSTALT